MQTPAQAQQEGYVDPAFPHVNFGNSQPKKRLRADQPQPVMPTAAPKPVPEAVLDQENGFKDSLYEIIPGQEWQSLESVRTYKNFKGGKLAPVMRPAKGSYPMGMQYYSLHPDLMPDFVFKQQKASTKQAKLPSFGADSSEVGVQDVDIEQKTDEVDNTQFPAMGELKSIQIEDIDMAVLAYADTKSSSLVKGGRLIRKRLTKKGEKFADQVHLAIQSQLVLKRVDQAALHAYEILGGLYPEIIQIQKREEQIAQDQEEGRSQSLINSGMELNRFIAKSIGSQIDRSLYDLCAAFQEAVSIYEMDKSKRIFRQPKDAFDCVIPQEVRETVDDFKNLRAQWKDMWEKPRSVEMVVQKSQILNNLMVLSARFNEVLASHEGAQALTGREDIKLFTAGLVESRLGQRQMTRVLHAH